MLAARPALLALLTVLAACAVGSPGPLPVTDGSLLDDYKLVHGMAEGAVQSASVDRDQLLRIIALDRDAVNALIALTTDNSGTARTRARDAIEVLAGYVTSVSAAPPEGLPPGINRTGAP